MLPIYLFEQSSATFDTVHMEDIQEEETTITALRQNVDNNYVQSHNMIKIMQQQCDTIVARM